MAIVKATMLDLTKVSMTEKCSEPGKEGMMEQYLGLMMGSLMGLYSD